MLILPKPATDEFALGYLGRLCHVNLKQSSSAMLRTLIFSFDLKSGAGARLKAVALASGMSIERFVQMHTLNPIIIEGGDVIRGRSNGGLRLPVGDERNPLFLSKKHAYFCKDCIEQQRKEWGFTYWNRIHQLPGIYWCPWHSTELTPASYKDISRTIPSTLTAIDTQPLGHAGALESPPINWYVANMLARLARGNECLTFHELSKQLRERAVASGLNLDKQSNSNPYLSDLVFSLMPAWWIKQEYPDSQKSMGQYFAPIDDILHGGRLGSREYALAMSFLCIEPIW